MKLNVFIRKLKDIELMKGGDAEVVMADNILVVKPFYSEDYPKHKKVVVITDGK